MGYSLENVKKIQSLSAEDNIITLNKNLIINPNATYSQVETAMRRLYRLSNDTFKSVLLTEEIQLDKLNQYECTNIDEVFEIDAREITAPTNYYKTYYLNTFDGILGEKQTTIFNNGSYANRPLKFNETDKTIEVEFTMLRAHTTGAYTFLYTPYIVTYYGIFQLPIYIRLL